MGFLHFQRKKKAVGLYYIVVGTTGVIIDWRSEASNIIFLLRDSGKHLHLCVYECVTEGSDRTLG